MHFLGAAIVTCGGRGQNVRLPGSQPRCIQMSAFRKAAGETHTQSKIIAALCQMQQHGPIIAAYSISG